MTPYNHYAEDYQGKPASSMRWRTSPSIIRRRRVLPSSLTTWWYLTVRGFTPAGDEIYHEKTTKAELKYVHTSQCSEKGPLQDVCYSWKNIFMEKYIPNHWAWYAMYVSTVQPFFYDYPYAYWHDCTHVRLYKCTWHDCTHTRLYACT